MTSPAPTYHFYALLPQPEAQRLLLLRDGEGYALPHIEHSEPAFWQSVEIVHRLIHERMGLNVTTLRCLKADYSKTNNRILRYYALENHSPDWTPPQGAKWVSHREINNLTLTQPEERAQIEAWFAWVEGKPTRVEWYNEGWFQTCADWILEQLKAKGIRPTGAVEQVRSWERSAILRVNTSEGLMYFKAQPPMFSHEPKLLEWLAQILPNDFPEVVAVDTGRSWLLMRDAGSQTLADVPDIDLWERALRLFGQVQAELAQHTDQLLALGCPDRRLDKLADRIEAMLNHSAEELSGSINRFTPEEIENLRGRLPKFKRVCAELAKHPIPASLEHGDFWQGQIVANGDQFRFIDWSDSSVSFPFFSMNFLSEAQTAFPDAPGARERLRNAYLEAWTAYEPMERLIQAFEMAKQVSSLHHALIYHEHILPAMEVKWEMSNMIPFYLKPLLPTELKAATDPLAELKNYMDEQGRLTEWPSPRNKKGLQQLALEYLAGKFEFDRHYTEKEVNAILRTWHTFGDHALLRRELYDKMFFDRKVDGTAYWRTEPPKA